jgi:hypothetical protein
LVKDASGNVGIGTSSPTANLHVRNTGGNATFKLEYGAGGTISQIIGASSEMSLQAAGASSITAYTNSAERMRIDSSGNVGIGNSSPNTYDSRLVVESNGKNTGLVVGDLVTPTNPTSIYLRTNGVASFFNAVGGSFAWGENGGTERMRIDSSGNLLVGTTLNQGSGRISIIPTAGGNNCISYQSATAGYYAAIFYTNTSTVAGYIVTGGSTTQYVTSSDYRLKNTIAPMTGALAKVALLNPVTYKWNADGLDGQGFIAHELQAIVPSCVYGEKDAVETYTDADGNEATRPVYQGVDTSFLVATLTAAIQEQQALITQLQADVATLKALKA